MAPLHAEVLLRRSALAASGGLAFAVLQFATYCLLEQCVSSACPTYAAVTASWMLGTLAGLRFGGGAAAEGAFGGAAAAAYYAVFAGVRLRPFDHGMLAVYALLVAVMGAFAGRFFRSRLEAWDDPRRLFLHENNGFLLGMLLSFAGFYGWAAAFLAAAPAAALGGWWLLRRAGWDR